MGVYMKKAVLVSVLAATFAGNAIASDYYEVRTNDCRVASMQNKLDQATLDGRAVVTVVKCDEQVSNNTVANSAVVIDTYNHNNSRRVSCGNNTVCGAQMERVVSREYFVREKVQKYRPIVKYVPDGAYTRVRAVCTDNICK